jgi:hypothetical protein
MKQKNKILTITNAKDALALVEKTADKVLIRKANPERGIKAKYASVQAGVMLTTAGRIISEKKFADAYAKRIDDATLTAVYGEMQKRINAIGTEALVRQAEAVKDGKRKVLRVWANLANGRTIVETITTNKIADIEAVVAATQIEGKPVVDAKKAEAIARNLAHHKLA